ncbi:glucosamine-6-phosphate deaminase [Massilimicrobiota timonensis]|jgi:glucosamine-6-phosphate deaminase|uniref:Glucosamine-6-phosphate deaminase n=1 Tax=Massilimicrobiota timonensis TaxID=1776392 RepID=A0ABT7UG05_9FIRM|nr:glucosamine-6-phosphate deaminase [Massilimicrobiota timonensis]MDM8195073.1 glucosamine-6-phosphate deaminase [Massilimicrobiota timonensis]
MKILVFEKEEYLDAYVGEYICHFIRNHSQPVIGFATGSTPLGVYRYFIDNYQAQKVSFRQVKAFNLDEYVGLTPSHPRSFASAMKNELFSHIDILPENINALDGSKEDMIQECQRYESLIDANPIDIQILGIGMDGHIAYNEPGSPLDGACHVVDLHQESIESSLDYGFDHIEDVPTQGVTQGIGTIMKAKQLIMMAKGEKKADLVKRMIYGEVTSDFPSSIIQRHPNVIVCLDRSAASQLKEEDYEKR